MDPMLMKAIAGSAAGVANVIGSFIGGGKRRREQRAAQAEFENQKAQFRDFQFKNTYAGLENVFEDATINQQAAQFQAAETDRALAGTMQAAVASGGAAGGAQALAQAALQSKQGISADIARQEQANQARRMAAEQRLQADEAAGADMMQTRQYQQSQQLLNLASERKMAADAARQRAHQQLMGGIGQMAGGAADFAEYKNQ